VTVASTGQTFVTTGVDASDSNSYEIYFGSRMPVQTASGVFLNPLGVLNSASFAPAGYPISPGGFVTMFGSFGRQMVSASAFPFPTLLGGVQVTINGLPAPLYFASPSQINCVVPYGATGSTATIVVTADGVKSNSVEVPLAASAPGIFSFSQNGLGDGTVQHANFTSVTAASPAAPGEIVQVYLTGLGAVSPAVQDGAAAPSKEPFSRVTAPVNVYVGGALVSNVTFKGLTPGLASLYQLNIQIPASVGAGAQSLAIQTAEGFTDMVNLRVQ
jgi:uncharacterized protein (TIGR03437 family)